MASARSYILFLSIFSLAFALGEAQQTNSNISLEATLHPSTNPTSWLSPNGHFAFGFYPEGTGFAIGTWLVASPDNTTVIWTADRDDPPVTKDAVLNLTSEGLKLLLQHSEGRLISQLPPNTVASSASMLDSGNFVIYDSNFKVIWETFVNPTDTIMAGQVLRNGYNLVSSASETDHSSGKFQLSMQPDGNLVQYPVASAHYPQDANYASGTEGDGYLSLYLDDNGWLYLHQGNVTSNLTSGYRHGTALVYRATLGVDGIFRLYSHDLELNTEQVLKEFAEVTDPCEVQGTCGLNSYCTSANGQAVVCMCLPGFDYLDTNRTSSGCRRNITTAAGCYLSNDNMTYMSTLESVIWMVDPYGEPLSVTSKEDCGEACLKDCNCDAALFSDNTCLKLVFPLRYGKTDDSTTTFIKLSNRSAGGRPEINSRPESPSAAPIITDNFSSLIISFSSNKNK
ncbi:G-type lectin S-receptor-like serine/threonine-protein kinase LECRK2 [Elaeis guineensis]|uniref:G-type lectin S-receptor-like serine/threonine-protein kinase LECRK2 n=1 Tax=Elaeis guineensis var. tenera TaxID=51953 RepID=A0A6I9QG56_ELAGV|nr:G-type lectin S-receptor-like serine/threonine-protein kinase LECRK2 [Elaeis guineensis]XP_010908853.1 G-type lectin S-receptor-like serine/threonine-protein kinase LECRK2 [Elaeis guineensis]XP_029117678.1 G-type lectin S-receptor-like serine/threonine-protein kinase LECRK2 [Elaeis guineensis]